MLAWVWSPPKFIPWINHYLKKKKLEIIMKNGGFMENEFFLRDFSKDI